jgi:chloramphenicol 3-O-phosphotransferase
MRLGHTFSRYNARGTVLYSRPKAEKERHTLLDVGTSGLIIILNGTQRSGKSSIGAAIQTAFEA